jgi:RNA polymerase sigma-70 factor (ECF subfamily)
MRASSPADTVATLETLMGEYVDGDAAAFRELYRRMSPKLLGYLMRRCRDIAVAEDALQNTFAKVHRARFQYLRGAPVAPWILVIARRSLYDELRSGRSREEFLSDDGALPEPTSEGGGGLSVDDAHNLESALAELPGHYREAIELTKLQGFSGGEAAKVLSTTQSAIKLRVHRGYRLLRERLEALAA